MCEGVNCLGDWVDFHPIPSLHARNESLFDNKTSIYTLIALPFLANNYKISDLAPISRLMTPLWLCSIRPVAMSSLSLLSNQSDQQMELSDRNFEFHTLPCVKWGMKSSMWSVRHGCLLSRGLWWPDIIMKLFLFMKLFKIVKEWDPAQTTQIGSLRAA